MIWLIHGVVFIALGIWMIFNPIYDNRRLLQVIMDEPQQNFNLSNYQPVVSIVLIISGVIMIMNEVKNKGKYADMICTNCEEVYLKVKRTEKCKKCGGNLVLLKGFYDENE